MSQFIEGVDLAKWDQILEKTPHEFYHKRKFCELDAKLLGGEAVAWYAELENFWMLIPLVKYKIPQEKADNKGLFDLKSPYGYPGYLSDVQLSPEIVNHFFREYNQQAYKQGYISSFLRLNPVLNSVLIDESDLVHQIIHGQVVILNLLDSYEHIFGRFRRDHRRNIRQLKKKGWEVEWNNWEELEAFISIYNETMERLNANDYYYFPKNYYLELFDMLSEKGIDYLLVKDPTGNPASAGLFPKGNGVIEYHLSGTGNEFLKIAPIKLMFDEIIKEYAGQYEFFNLGGGVGNQADSLFDFKLGFGKQLKKFSTVRMIHDKTTYYNLCQDMPKKEREDLTGFFPAYRRMD